MKRSRLIGLVVLVLLAAIAGGTWRLREWNRTRLIAPFDQRIGDFLGLETAPPNALATAAIKGKVLVIDLGKQKVDVDLFFRLPEDLRPGSPEEVGTVVLVRWQDIQVDEYSNKGKAYRVDGVLTVIHRDSKEVVADDVVFAGGDPPAKIKQSAPSGKGPKPFDKIIEYLVRLPKAD